MKKTFRYPAIAAVIFSIIFLPYWVYVPALFTALIVFPFFWEGIILGFVIDALYGVFGFSFYFFIRSFGFWALLVLIALLPLRKIIRSYA